MSSIRPQVLSEKRVTAHGAAAATAQAEAVGLELRAVTRTFGKVTALKNLTLAVRDREFVTLLGPSGCGKTTLLRIIAGFDRPASGQVIIAGHDVTRMRP